MEFLLELAHDVPGGATPAVVVVDVRSGAV
jgi:hypothetical protein